VTVLSIGPPPMGAIGWLSMGGSGPVSTGAVSIGATGTGVTIGAAAALRIGWGDAPDRREEEQALTARAETSVTPKAADRRLIQTSIVRNRPQAGPEEILLPP
jgi:hypothetical protein